MEWLTVPLAILFLGALFLVIFRKPISRLIDRTKKIGKLGLEAAGSPALQQVGTDVKPSPVDELLKPFENPVFLHLTEATVKFHIGKLLRKTGAKDRPPRQMTAPRVSGEIPPGPETRLRLDLTCPLARP